MKKGDIVQVTRQHLMWHNGFTRVLNKCGVARRKSENRYTTVEWVEGGGEGKGISIVDTNRLKVVGDREMDKMDSITNSTERRE